MRIESIFFLFQKHKTPMLDRQLEHHEIKNKQHDLDIILIAENIQSPANIGLLLRTAEAMGVRKIYVVSDSIKELSPKMKRVSRNTQNFVALEFIDHWQAIVSSFPDHTVLGLDKTKKSIAVNQYHLPHNKIILFCGNEQNGLSPEAIQRCKQMLHIPMFGKNSSMNVAVATGIGLFSLISENSKKRDCNYL